MYQVKYGELPANHEKKLFKFGMIRVHEKAEAELQKKVEAAAKKARAAEKRKRKRDAQEEALAKRCSSNYCCSRW